MKYEEYRCIDDGGPFVPPIFTKGKIYPYAEDNQNQPTVRDNYGRLRVIGHDLNFIVRNDGYGMRGVVTRAFFERV
jgi:hypothetical protein